MDGIYDRRSRFARRANPSISKLVPIRIQDGRPGLRPGTPGGKEDSDGGVHDEVYADPQHEQAGTISNSSGDRGAQGVANGGVLKYVGVRRGAGNEGIRSNSKWC